MAGAGDGFDIFVFEELPVVLAAGGKSRPSSRRPRMATVREPPYSRKPSWT